MIEFLRIDDRLLHGQVVAKWLRTIGPDAIVVADDEIVNNEIGLMALKMAKPDGMKLAVKSVSDAITLINDRRTAGMKLFVITRTSERARQIVDQTGEVNILNVGGMSNKKEGGRMVLGNVYMDKQDIKNIKDMGKKVHEIDVRVVPTNSKKDFMRCVE